MFDLARSRSPILVVAGAACLVLSSMPAVEGQGLFRRLRSRVVQPPLQSSPINASPRVGVEQPYPGPNTGAAQQQQNSPNPLPGGRTSSSPNPAASNPTDQTSEFGPSILDRVHGPGPADSSGDDSAAQRLEQDRRSSGTLGLQVRNPRPDVPAVQIVSFNAESLADESGVKALDLILSIDRVPTPTIADIASFLSKRKPGDRVTLGVSRGGRPVDLVVPLVARPSIASASRNPAVASSGEIGKTSSAKVPIDQSDEDRPELGIDVEDHRSSRGALVVSIEEDSPAAAAGIRKGDRIVAINGRMTADTDQLANSIARHPVSAPILVKVVRSDRLIDLVVRYDQSASDPSGGEKSADDKPADSMFGGFGSAIDDLFGSQSTSSPKESPNATGTPKAGTDGTVASALAADGSKVPGNVATEKGSRRAADLPASSDILAFSDDEPLDQVIFDEEADSKENSQKSRDKMEPVKGDPPSLESIFSTRDRVVEELKAEIRRLREQIRTMEAKAAKE